VTTFAAVHSGAFDLAIGNIFGSNVFNMVILVIVDLFQAGPLFTSLSPSHARRLGHSYLVHHGAQLALALRIVDSFRGLAQ
jgi:hypothetical protein